MGRKFQETIKLRDGSEEQDKILGMFDEEYYEAFAVTRELVYDNEDCGRKSTGEDNFIWYRLVTK